MSQYITDDDSDRWPCHEPAFDFEGADEDGYWSAPRCDGDDRGCPGCRHCAPVSREDKPYGWGIEPFESAEVYRLTRELRANWSVVCGTVPSDLPPLAWSLACRWAGPDPRTVRASERVWEKCCCECETHAEAVRRYGEWATRISFVQKH